MSMPLKTCFNDNTGDGEAAGSDDGSLTNHCFDVVGWTPQTLCGP